MQPFHLFRITYNFFIYFYLSLIHISINISGAGSVGIRNKNGKDEHGNPITTANLIAAGANATNGASPYNNESGSGTQPAVAGNTTISPSGVVTINGKVVPIHDLTPGPNPIVNKNYAFSNVGIYIDTLGRTNPINWIDGFNPVSYTHLDVYKRQYYRFQLHFYQ